jgi:hypothetical protein
MTLPECIIGGYLRQSKTRKRCKSGAVDGEVRKKVVAIWDESKIVAM